MVKIGVPSGSYRKIETGVPLFGLPGMLIRTGFEDSMFEAEAKPTIFRPRAVLYRWRTVLEDPFPDVDARFINYRLSK